MNKIIVMVIKVIWNNTPMIWFWGKLNSKADPNLMTMGFLIVIIFVLLLAFISLVYHSIKMWRKTKRVSVDYQNNYIDNNKKTLKISYFDFLNNEEIFEDLERPHYASILTMLGILGTFVGIASALLNVDIKAISADDTIAFKNMASGIFAGMRTAFYTSVLGISSSILYLMMTKVSAFTIRSRINKLFKKEWATYEVETTEYFLRQQGDNISIQKDSAETLKKAGESFTGSAENLKKVIENIETTISPEKLGEIITEGLNHALTHEIKPVFEEIRDYLNVIPSLNENQNKMAQAVEKFSIFVTQDLNDLLINTRESVEKINENLEKNTISLGVFTNNVNTFSVSITETKNVINSFIEISEKWLSDIFEKINASQDKFENTIISYQDTSNKKYTEYISSLEKHLENVFQNLRDIQREFEDSIKIFNKNTNLQLTTFQDHFLEEVKKKVADTFKDISEEQKEIRKLIYDEYGKFIDKLMREQKDVFSEFTKNQKQVFKEHLGKYSEDLSITIQNFEKVFNNEYNNRVEMLNKSANTTDKLLNVVNTSTILFESQKDQLGDFAKKSVSAFKEMEKSNRLFITNLETIDKSLKKVSSVIGNEVLDTINQYFDAYHKSQKEYMVETDSHIKGILDQILGTTGQLQENFEKEKNN